MATQKFRKSKSRTTSRRRKTVRRHRASTAGKILPPLDVRSRKHLSEFEKRMKKGPLMIVMVYADWCGACHTMMPHFDAAAKSRGRSIQAVKVNEQMLQAVNESINKNVNKFAKPLNVEGYPSIIIVDKKGNAVTEIEPVRNTESMTALMAQAGPLAENAGINRTNENPNTVVKAGIENIVANENPENPENVNNASNAMAMISNNKNKKLLTNLGIENQGLVTGGPKGNNMNLSRNVDVGEDELLGSIASKNNKNKNIKLASIAPNKLANAALNSEKSVKNVKESLKEATAPSPLNTFESVKNESKGPAVSANIKKEAEAVTSLAAPLMPPSVGSDMEESESISNKLTAEQKVSGGGYNRKDGGSLYSAMARTTYLLAPAAGLLATAAMVMKGKKRGKRSKLSTHKASKHSKKSRKTLRRRR